MRLKEEFLVRAKEHVFEKIKQLRKLKKGLPNGTKWSLHQRKKHKKKLNKKKFNYLKEGLHYTFNFSDIFSEQGMENAIIPLTPYDILLYVS